MKRMEGTESRLFWYCSFSEYRSFADSLQVKLHFLFLKKGSELTKTLYGTAEYDTYRIKADCSQDGDEYKFTMILTK